MSEIIMLILFLGLAASVFSTVRAVRARKPEPPRRRRPFEDAFDRAPRVFGKRTTPPEVPVFPVDPYL